MPKIYQESDIEIIIATMNRTTYDFLDAMFVHCDWDELSILIINQTEQNLLLESNKPNVKVINSFEKGLSKSRNLGLQHATKELVVFTDDDVVYKDDFLKTIVNSFNQFQSQVVQFQIEDFSNNLFKKYHSVSKTALSTFDCLNVMSIELVYSKSFLKQNNISFDENFGLGSEYPFGEENILLHDVLDKKGLISFEPKAIALHKKETSVDVLTNQEKYYNLGAFYYRICREKYWRKVVVKLVFDVKQKKVALKEIVSLLQIAKKGKLNYAKQNCEL